MLMPLKKIIVFTLLILPVTTFYGQQNNIWYFGRQAGLNFNPTAGKPVPFPDFNSGMTANEGCSTICDAAGHILFYTNGNVVYNKLHQVMLNGNGLLGHISAFQSSIIVPLPNNDSLFYIFTADAFENKFANGYRYSVVNIKNDNGKGEVIIKNVLLSSPSTERLTAARHSNGIDVWIITNDKSSNVFRAWLLNCNGLQLTPVISSAGSLMNQQFDMNLGGMKISPDGSKLCQTHFPDIDNSFPENFFQLFDFNNTTGQLSNAKLISYPNQRYYACEFSPDSKLLYVSKTQDSTIDQFNVSSDTTAAIITSRISIPAVFGIYGLQLAPDNKIYLARSNSSISVISNPNIPGTGCKFELNKINITGRNSGLNLPSYINDQSINPFISFTILDSCKGSMQFFGIATLPGPIQWNWNFGDGSTSTLQNPVHVYPSSKTFYTVTLRITSPSVCGYIERTKTISAGGLLATADFDFIPDCDSGFVKFINKSVIFPDNGTQYFWNFGDGTTSSTESPVHSFPGAGNYDVKLKIFTSNACLNDSITQQLNFQLMNIQAPPDQTIDIGQSVQLSTTGGGTQFTWTPTTWLSNPSISNPVASPLTDITYAVNATNNSGCTDTDSVTIKVRPAKDIYVPTGFTPNNDGINDVLRPFVGYLFNLDEFTVYNRWGQKVFTTKNKTEGWNGMVNGLNQPAGVYVWWARSKRPDGKIINKKGTAVLIR